MSSLEPTRDHQICHESPTNSRHQPQTPRLPRVGVGDFNERSRAGGGGFPVYKRPFDIRLGRPSRALLRLTILSRGFHHGLI